jgi:hypothetical protein
MSRNGRGIDPVFGPTEKLFRRYKQDHFVGGQFSNMGFSFKNPPSVNRAKYSKAPDVVFSEADEWAKWGVLSFQVQHLPVSSPPDRPEYSFLLAHIPQEINYSHSEVNCDRIPASGTYVEPRQAVRKLVRTALSQRITVEIEAEI